MLDEANTTLAPAARLAPTAAHERIAAMDVLRGFALFGIFAVNIEWFTRPFQEFGSGVPSGLAGADHAVAWAVHVLLAGKFWILFSLLFGMGFAVMMERAAAAGRPFVRLYLRRIAVLFAFGIAHALLLWVGDILHTYALAALALLLARKWRPRTQLAVGVALYSGLGLLMFAAALAMSAMPIEADPEVARTAAEAAAAAQVYAGGDYAAITAQRLRDFAMFVGYNAFTVPSAWAMFLIGAWLVRSGRLRDLPAQRGFYRRLALFALPVGLALSLASAAVGVSFAPEQGPAPPTQAAALMMLGALPLSLGYLSLLMLLLASPAPRLAWLAPVGRMALSNYLLQSLLCTTLFYGYGFALWGELGRAAQLGVVLTIFALQVLLSREWLARFRFGPMEWLWRWATYGVRPPLRQAE